MKYEFWTIAYRRRQGASTLLDNRNVPFCVIANNWRYWYADPHLIKVAEHTWLFAEAYDRVLRRGVISCCMLTDKGPTPWKVVLKQPYHLSYPHLFEAEGKICMIPESYVAGEIALFSAEKFPDQWKKETVLRTGGEPVDSTVFSFGGKRWLLSLLQNEGKDQLMLYPYCNSRIVGEGYCVKESDLNMRPGGHLFQVDGEWIRPAQDCTESYGCALNFYRVDGVSESKYEETMLLKLHPQDIKTDCVKVPQGIHTYNMTEEYEVIDLKTYENDLLAFPMRVIWGVWRRVNRIFRK